MIRERVEIQNLRIGVDRRNAIFVRFRLHIRENVVALLHLDEGIADARAILSVAGKRVQNAPVVVHVFVARFAIDISRKRNVGAVGKQLQEFVPQPVKLFDGNIVIHGGEGIRDEGAGLRGRIKAQYRAIILKRRVRREQFPVLVGDQHRGNISG